MNKSIIFILALLAVISLPALRVDITVPAPSLQGNLVHSSTEQPVVVCLPPSYQQDASRHYPVLYLLPGFRITQERFFNGYYSGMNLDAALDSLYAAQEIAEMIVVVVPATNALGGHFYVNSAVTGNWEDFVCHDLVTYIDTTYRTIDTSSGRALCGSSMGGFGALNLAMKHPDRFSCCYALAPGIYAPDGLRSQAFLMSANWHKELYAQQARFDSLDAESAHTTYLAFADSLQQRDRRYWFLWLFTYAYGAAFAPQTAHPPYIRYPLFYKAKYDDLLIDPEVVAQFENGFGNWETKLARYAANLRKLTGIVIDFGSTDTNRWIPDGCIYLASLLKKHTIEHELYSHPGGHEDALKQRLLHHALPWISTHLHPAK